MTYKYKVAIIGTGRMGGLIQDEVPDNSFSSPYGHFSSYEFLDSTSVIAVANRGEARLKRFSARFGVDKTYLDYREMIEKEKPDIVSVTTPSVNRADPIIFAAENGVKGIYAEKGLCASLAEADKIRNAIISNKVAFNWGAMRRHHDGYVKMAEAIANGQIGEPRYAVMLTHTDLIKHHPHTIDLVQMQLGDPEPIWVEGTLVKKGDLLEGGRASGPKRRGRSPISGFPEYNAESHSFPPPEGEEIADPMVGYFRVGFKGGVEGLFLPTGTYDIEIYGTEGKAYSWENGDTFKIRRAGKGASTVEEIEIRPSGDSPTVSTIKNIINEIETGERTTGNIDVTMQAVETQFGVAHSDLLGGARVELPVKDRTLYIPGG